MTRFFQISARYLAVFGVVWAFVFGGFPVAQPASAEKPAAEKKAAAPEKPAAPANGEKPATPEKPAANDEEKPAKPANGGDKEKPGNGDAVDEEDDEEPVVARPVNAEPVQVFGWRENVLINGVAQPFRAKLDTGALTSSIHVEEKELFERDGKKWVRFIVTDPRAEKPVRTRLEAPLVRMARIKDPGAESRVREVVRLEFQIGERRMRGEFTLSDRSNMLVPVLIGRTVLADLGWVDSSRTDLAEKKIFR